MPRKSRRHKQDNNIQDPRWQQAWNDPEAIDAAKKQALLNSINQRIDNHRRNKRRLFFIGISAAAAILVAIFIKIPDNNSRINVNNWRELTSNDSSKKIMLDDGSELWLAPHSVVKIYPDFLKQRSTILTQGTVFFSVAKDAQHPFSIAVNRQKVTVLGTAFTIHKIDSVDIQLTVKKGKVALDNPGGRRLLTAGQEVRTTGAISGAVQPVNPAAADWWLKQQVRWENISLEELLNLVQSYYQVTLSYGTVNRKMKVTLTWDLALPLKDNLAILNSLTGYNIH